MNNGKNVKGIIGLVLGLLSIALVIAACLIPLEPIKGTGVNFYGKVNVIMCLCALVLAIAAIVFGAMSKKDADKKGPRKAGVIIGIIMIIVSLLSSMALGFGYLITDCLNNGENSKLYQAMKDDPESKDKLEEAIEEFRTQIMNK